ncbi:hypothetical protein QE152_g13225 [Popillia japonica]|uniref:Transposase n=1 Tax=Popillia japonica TaxID=7064 RepID=A0AAW1LEC5_POPJA
MLGELRAKKTCMSKSRVKTMIFFLKTNPEDIAAQTCTKKPELWATKNWFLHYDNAPAQSIFTREFLASTGTALKRRSAHFATEMVMYRGHGSS